MSNILIKAGNRKQTEFGEIELSLICRAGQDVFVVSFADSNLSVLIRRERGESRDTIRRRIMAEAERLSPKLARLQA